MPKSDVTEFTWFGDYILRKRDIFPTANVCCFIKNDDREAHFAAVTAELAKRIEGRIILPNHPVPIPSALQLDAVKISQLTQSCSTQLIISLKLFIEFLLHTGKMMINKAWKPVWQRTYFK